MGEIVVKHVLMVAFHYPPVQVSSGVQRSLAFSRYLQEHGWDPVVLTAHPRAYPAISDNQMKDIPESVPVKRAFALDTSKHISIGSKYPGILALPDRWIGWWFGGIWSGLQLIRKYRPKVIWSTYPIATAHLIGLTLQRLTGLPWVADFRDSMTELDYPQAGPKRRAYLWIEKKVVRACTKAVFTTPGAVRMYRERYPELPKDKWLLLPNGYNEEIFSEIEADLLKDKSTKKRQRRDPFVLVHSGVIYPSERDPRPFFQALANLRQRHAIDASRLRVILRATGHDALYQPMIEELGIDDIVFLEPGVSYRDALKEMMSADALLILQATSCNHQVPAKVYEYFRARRPVLSFTDRAGDTAIALSEAGLSDMAPLDDKEEIQRVLLSFIEKLELGSAAVANDKSVQRYSRQAAAKTLAGWLDLVET